VLTGLVGGVFACTSTQEPEAAALPSNVRADYLVFAQRCSKCHSLARPLNSGIDNDEYWKRYVERMRRQPASGISVADTVPILRFLHAYSSEQRKMKEALLDAPVSSTPVPSAPQPDAALPDAGGPAAGGAQ
jgi:hypothetical protein